MAKKAVKANGGKKLQKVTPQRAGVKWENAFLSALAESGVVRSACEAAKVSRNTAYKRREQSPSFFARWNEAIEDFADSLEAEAVRRARDGIVKGVYHQGILMSTELQYSDTLMSQMLKAKRPAEYGDKLTIKLDPTHLALLRKLNMTPSDAWEMLIQELANADANATTISD